MATIIANGRRINVPDSTTAEEIQQTAGMHRGRRLIRKTREGNYFIHPNSKVQVQDGDRFVDAPPRVKG